ncbi:MAG: cytosine permease [Alphaproteobacteria bacterium]|nr:MAG: cytosine permease [Alphaproteobacteria bacterium]
MNKFDELVEDYSKKPVPDTRTVSGIRVALVIIGISIALPAFVAGIQIGSAVGLTHAIIAFFAGGLILTILGVLTSVVGARARLTTYMLVQFSFGPQGARLVNFILAATMFGWFGVNASLFGKATATTMEAIYGYGGLEDLYVAIGGALMVVTTIFGFRALDKLSLFAVPVLLAILVGIMALSVTGTDPATLFATARGDMTLGLAISATAGGMMAGVVTMPDLARYLAGKAQAVIAMVLAFALGGPTILLTAAVPSLATGQSDLLLILLSLGFGVPALFLLIFATWTSNAANVYSSGLSLAATFPGVHRWKLTVAAGAAGTLLAIAGIMDHFVPFLVGLGVTIPPVAGIYVAHFYFVAHQRYDLAILSTLPPVRWRAFVGWAAGVAVGCLGAYGGVTLTTIPALDSLLVSGALYLFLQGLFPHRWPGDKRGDPLSS